MLKLTPILLALLYGAAMYGMSAFRTKRQLDANSTELLDPGLGRVFDRLAEALDVERVRVFLYNIDPVNGLAAPDGRIFLTRGFYDRYRRGLVTAEEMASVVAHELGHVALGHTRKRMIDFTGQNALRMAGGMILGRLLPFGFGVWIANALASMLAARLSRDDEYEADAYAAALLTKAGIGTEPQKALFRKLDTLTQSRGAQAMPVWFLSHPKAPDRIAAIERLEDRWHGLPDG